MKEKKELTKDVLDFINYCSREVGKYEDDRFQQK